MRKHAFETPGGEVWLWGDEGALESQRPVVLFINGAFSIERPRSFELQAALPAAAVFNAHLPGNHSPPPTAHSVDAYGRAYSAAIDQIGRPAIVMGASVGALTVLSMRSPLIRGLVLLEPFLKSRAAAPLVGAFRERLLAAPQDAELRDFLWTVFGVSETAHENRDYRALADALTLPAIAAFGGAREPGPGGPLPSLVDDADREYLRTHPQVRTEVIPGVGHNLPGFAPNHTRRYAQTLLDEHVLSRTTLREDRN